MNRNPISNWQPMAWAVRLLLIVLPYAVHAQPTQVATWAWPADTSVVVSVGDSLPLQWSPTSSPVRSFGITDLITLRHDPRRVTQTVPMDLRLTLEVDVTMNPDHGNYDPVDDKDSLFVLQYEIGIRGDSIAPLALRRSLDRLNEQAHQFTRAHRFTLHVVALEVDLGSGYGPVQQMPPGVFLDIALEWRRTPILDLNELITDLDEVLIGCAGIVTDAAQALELEFQWNAIDEAVAYDVEWTWVDDHHFNAQGDPVVPYPPNAIEYDLAGNASRATVTTDHYRIPLLFDRGYVIWRVRPVGIHPVHPELRVQGPWSGADPDGTVVPHAQEYYVQVVPHQRKKNWQVTTSFAEEGKRKEVMTYADGTSRARQVQTRINSLHVPIIGETVYDAVGRPAVQVMPVPLVKEGCEEDGQLWAPIAYVPDFNEEATTDPADAAYTYKDLSGEGCAISADPMSNANGAEHYYSTAYANATEPLVEPAPFIPQAEQFPFSQTEYTRDNTGRVRKQGGVGPTFQLGQDHATITYYGKPEQIQLDRLFGSEAGYASHYQRIVTRDANKQNTVTYVDMMGRTVATALTCASPPTMEPLVPVSTSTLLTSDLFGGLPSTDPGLHQRNADAMTFTTQLAVACDATYTFDYDVVPLHLSDPCWQDTDGPLGDLCARCVYELDIRLVDACGGIVFQVPEANAPLVLGTITDTEEGYLFACEDGPGYTMESITRTVSAGEYTLTKTLRIHAPARQRYVEEFLDTLNNDCLISWPAFLADALDDVDTTDCYVTCADCYEDLGTLDEYLAEGGVSETMYYNLLEECDELCRADSWCTVLYGNILEDMSRHGQYGRYELNGSNQAVVTDGASVFLMPSGGQGSVLRYMFTNTSNPINWRDVNYAVPLWRQPWREFDGGEERLYRDNSGERTKVAVSETEPGVFIPALVNVNAPWLFEEDGQLYTWPENLLQLEDFLSSWQPGWERSLARFHPEYCYYRECRVYGEPFTYTADYTVEPSNSDEFDGRLTIAATFDQAVDVGLLNPDGTHNFLTLDPFVSTSAFSPHSNVLSAKVAVYFSAQGGNYSMAQVAAVMAQCGGNFPPDPGCATPPTDASPANVKDAYWAALRGYYRSVKYAQQKRRADDHMKACGCPGLNYCIGEDDPSVWWFRMQTSAPDLPFFFNWLSQPLNRSCQPCNRWLYTYYDDKVARVGNPDQASGLNQTPMQQAQQNFLVTGQCPLATAWQNYFNALFMDGLLTQNGTFDISEHSGWTGIYVALNDMELATQAPPAQMTVAVTNAGISITTNNGCTITLADPQEADFAWDRITYVGQLVAEPNSTAFRLALYYVDEDQVPHVVEVDGTMCELFDLAPCNFPRTCDPNQLARDVQDLWNMVKPNNAAFTMPSVALQSLQVPGGGATIAAMLGPSLTARFGSGAVLHWRHQAAGPVFAVSNGTAPNAPRYRFDLLEVEPSTFTYSNAEWSTIDYFSDINGDFENFFTITGRNVNGDVVATFRGQAWWEEDGEVEPVVLGLCGLAENPLCAGNEYQYDEQLGQVLQDVFYSTSFNGGDVDLFASPNMTDALASQLCPPLLENELEGPVFEATATLLQQTTTSYTYEVCDCLTIEVPRTGGAVHGTGLDLTASIMENDPDTNDTYATVRYPILPSGTRFLSVTTTCAEFMPCDTCNPEPIPVRELLGVTEEELIAAKVLRVDTIWQAYLRYEELVAALNDRLDLGVGDPGYVERVSYADFRRGGFWLSLDAYEKYTSEYKPAIDKESYLHHLDSFVVAHTNALTVGQQYERYAKAVAHYNDRALAANKPTMPLMEDSLFIASILADHVGAYVDMLYARNPQNTLPVSIATYGTLDPEDPCVQRYLQDYLPAYWTMENAHTDSTGRCPKFEFFAPLATYKEFLDANLCCSDSGVVVLNAYLELLVNDSAKCPGELPRLDPCEAGSTAGLKTTRVPEEECQRLYTTWFDIVRDYMYDEEPWDYFVSTGIVLDLEYLDYESFLRAGLCDCIQDYLTYIGPYKAWKLGDEPLPPLLSIDEFCDGGPKDCEDLFRDYETAIVDFNSSTFSDVRGIDLDQHYYTFAAFEQRGMCACVEEYLAYLAGYISWEQTMGNWPKPLTIEQFCGVEDQVDCEGLYDHYVTQVVSLQPILIALNQEYEHRFNFKFVEEEFFHQYDLCWCVEAYLAYLDVLFADPEANLQTLASDPTVWNLAEFCEIPVPCDPLPPYEPTPTIILEADTNDCVRALYSLAIANAQNDYDAYLQHFINDITNRYDSVCLRAEEHFQMAFEDQEHHYTLYYYDQAGSLIRTVPPEGVSLIDIDHFADSIAVRIARDRALGTHSFFTDHRLPSDHVYNSLGQPIRSAMPDQDAREEWRAQVPLGLSPSLRITGATFTGGGRGYLTGHKDGPPGLLRGMVYATSNAGDTWQRLPGVLGTDLYGIHYPSTLVGYAVGDQGSLLRTVDGGTSWDLLPTGLLSTRPALRATFFLDNDRGVLVGRDGYAATTLNATSSSPSFNALSLAGAGHLYAVGGNTSAITLAGSDAGDNIGQLFTAATLSGPFDPVTGLRTAAPLTCVTEDGANGLYTAGERGVLLHSATAGAGWTTRRTDHGADHLDMAWFDALHGVVLIDSLDANDVPTGVGVLRYTGDGGATWHAFPDCPAVDLNDLYLYARSTTMIQVLAVGDGGRVLRISIAGSGVSVTNLTGLPGTVNGIGIWAAASGSPQQVKALVVDGTGTVHFTRDLNLFGAIWEPHTVAGEELHAIAAVHVGNAIHAVAVNSTDGTYVPLQFELAAPTVFLADLAQGSNLLGLAHRSANTVVLYSAEGPAHQVDLSAWPVTSTTISTTSDAPTACKAVLPRGTADVVVVGDAGDIRAAAGPLATPVWTDQSATITPLPIYALDPNGAVGAGAKGTFYVGTQSGWTAIPTRSTQDLLTVRARPTIWIGAGEDGIVLRMDGAAPYGTEERLALPAPATVRGADIPSANAIALVGDEGRVWYTTDYTDPVPAWQLSTTISSTLRAVAAAPSASKATAVGMNAEVWDLVLNSGLWRTANHEVYTPPLHGLWFKDAQNGYVVGADNTIRRTQNGGLHWQAIPITHAPRSTFRAVAGNASRPPLAVGDDKRVVSLEPTGPVDITLTAGASTTDLRAIAVSASGAVVIGAEDGSAGRVYKRTALSSTWTSNTVPQPLYTAWAFQPYMADQPGVDNERSAEDFLLAGADGYFTAERFIPATNLFNNIGLWTGGSPSQFSSVVRGMAWHDRTDGYLVLSDGAGSRIRRVAWAVDHGTALSVPDNINGTNNLIWLEDATMVAPDPDETVTGSCVAISDRNRLFVGGTANTTDGFARTLNDEGKLYSQRFWYDALGRLVLSQNSKQFAQDPKRFSYSLYDALGRVVEAGELEDGIVTPDRFVDLPATEVNGIYLPNVLDPAELQAWVLDRKRYEVTRTYYDRAPFDLTPQGLEQTHLRLRVASTLFFLDEFAQPTPDEAEYDHAIHYSYDIHGNVRTLLQDVPALGLDGRSGSTQIDHRYKRIDYEYDLISGNVKRVNYQRDQPDEFYHRYSYDADNRITQVRTSADGNHWHTDARYFYYAHGPLQRVELGAHKVQGIDYAYTLQGWLKGINSNLLAPTVDMGRDGDLTDADPSNDLIGRDAYGLSLGYYGAEDYKAIGPQWANIDGRPFAPIGPGGTLSDEHRPLYNGNIAHTVNTLQPFGLWNSGNGAQGQVLAQVYQYDQLNRLKQARGVEGLTSNNRWQTVTDAETDRYRSSYTYDANGNITTAERWDRDGNKYDQFSYKYEQRGGRLERNRLYQLNDLADEDNLLVNEANGAKDIAYTGDVPFASEAANINGAYNYSYDQLGNLIKDDREGIANIQWTVAGKVKQVEKTDGTVLTFAYGADGQRLWKEVTPPVLDDTGYREYYIRDAQGNIMATYRSQLITVPSPEPQGYAASLRVTERPVYGSSRLGTYARWEELYDHPVVSTPAPDPVQPVDLNYELTDHLGNVTAVVTGRLLNGNGGGTPKQAELVSAQGYEAFGALLPGRNFSSDSYRFGFNGKENDNEVHGATGTFQDYGMRAYDNRVGRFFSVDPIAAFYPYFTPYQFSGNNPIKFIDLDGLEQDDPTVRLFYECAPQIDMTCAPELSPTNAAGYPRNGPWFWRKMLEAHPGQFSESNAAAIRQGRSPTADAQWIKFNPTHAPYEGNTLIHHHVNQGKMAVGIPKQVHLDFFSKLHPNLRAGIKMSGKGIRGGLGVFASFADFAGVFTGNPDNMYYNMLVAPAVGDIHAIPSEGNQFIGSGQYYVPTSITKEYYESGALKSVSMSMDIYNGATWDDDAKKYVGVDKVGSSSVRYNYDESGNQTEFQQN